MDDWDFEHLVADLWERQGWSTEVEQQSTDAGVDVRATKSLPHRQKALIQAKRYGQNTTVGGPDIQQYSSLRQQEADADQAVVVTTGRFTKSARRRAQDLNVKLIDGDDLVELIEHLDAHDAVEKYLDTAPATETDDVQTGDVDVSAAADTGSESGSSHGLIRRALSFSFGLLWRGVTFLFSSLRSGYSAHKPEQGYLLLIPGISLDDNWSRRTLIGLAIWTVFLLGLSENPSQSILSMFVNISWTLMAPIVFASLWLDIKQIRRSEASWNPRPWFWVILPLALWHIGFGIYFFERWRHLRKD
jgi:hypothetical protein